MQALTLPKMQEICGMTRDEVLQHYDNLSLEQKRLLHEKMLSRIVYMQLSRYQCLIESGKVVPGTIPSGVETFLRQGALIRGEPTQRVEHVKKQVLTHKEIEDYIRNLPPLKIEVFP